VVASNIKRLKFLMAGLDPAIQIQSALVRWITGSRRFAAAR
jgi:hypothetical protein